MHARKGSYVLRRITRHVAFRVKSKLPVPRQLSLILSLSRSLSLPLSFVLSPCRYDLRMSDFPLKFPVSSRGIHKVHQPRFLVKYLVSHSLCLLNSLINLCCISMVEIPLLVGARRYSTASLSHLRIMLPESSSCPQPAKRPIHATESLFHSKTRYSTHKES